MTVKTQEWARHYKNVRRNYITHRLIGGGQRYTVETTGTSSPQSSTQFTFQLPPLFDSAWSLKTPPSQPLAPPSCPLAPPPAPVFASAAAAPCGCVGVPGPHPSALCEAVSFIVPLGCWDARCGPWPRAMSRAALSSTPV